MTSMDTGRKKTKRRGAMQEAGCDPVVSPRAIMRELGPLAVLMGIRRTAR